jgi:hypothetical protein
MLTKPVFVTGGVNCVKTLQLKQPNSPGEVHSTLGPHRSRAAQGVCRSLAKMARGLLSDDVTLSLGSSAENMGIAGDYLLSSTVQDYKVRGF